MRRSTAPSILGLLLVLLGAGLTYLRPEILEGLERRTYDLRFRLRGPRAGSGRVAIVAIDDATLDRRPAILTRRAEMARLIEAIRGAGARAIGLDAFFPEPERLLPEDLERDLRAFLATGPARGDDGGARSLLRRIAETLDGDARLARAISARPDTVLALHLGDRGSLPADPRALRRGTYGLSTPGPRTPADAPRVLASIPKLSLAAAALGTIGLRVDDDRVLRSLRVATFFGGRPFAPLALQVLAIDQGGGRGSLAYAGGDPPVVTWGEHEVPLDPGQSLFLDFHGRAAFRVLSAADVLAGEAPEGALEGRMVLVGITYLAHDTIDTPLDDGLPGVFVHAEAIEDFLEGRFVRRAAPALDATIALGVGLLGLLAFRPRWRIGPGSRLAVALLPFTVYLAAAYLLFVREGLWLALAGPGMTTGAALLSGLTSGWLLEGLQRRRLRRTFAYYLSPKVIEELLRRPESLTLGGARRELTVLFSDIRGFTTLAEVLSPEATVSFLGHTLGPLTEAVLEAGGLLDKYIGDAIMAVFGAPVDTGVHAEQALTAALSMHAALERVRSGGEGPLREVRIGVGVNTGEMVVGNLGSRRRFDYTVVGDAVNLASRLEGLTKVYGVFCLVGEATAAAAAPTFTFREVDRVRVKGKAKPVAVFELLEGPGRAVAEYHDLARFSAGMEAWRAGNFSLARREFQAFLEVNPDDPVATLYLERIETLEETPPPAWDGVFDFEHK